MTIAYAFTLAQIVGYLATLISIMCYQARDQSRLFALNMLSDAVWTIHYAMLGAIPPLISTLVSFARTGLGVFVFPGHRGLIAFLGFVCITILCIKINDDGMKGYLPILAGLVFSLVTYFNRHYLISRLLIATGLGLWVIIGALYGSIGEVISSLIGMGSVFLGMIRHSRSDRRKAAKAASL